MFRTQGLCFKDRSTELQHVVPFCARLVFSKRLLDMRKMQQIQKISEAKKMLVPLLLCGGCTVASELRLNGDIDKDPSQGTRFKPGQQLISSVIKQKGMSPAESPFSLLGNRDDKVS